MRALLVAVVSLTLMGCGIDPGHVAFDEPGHDELVQLLAEPLSSTGSALDSVGAAEVLPSGGFTLFAPDNRAWFAVEPEEIARILSNPEIRLELLRNHVVARSLPLSELADGARLETVSGQVLHVERQGEDVRINGGRVKKADIRVGDAVVHVIDTVLPPHRSAS